MSTFVIESNKMIIDQNKLRERFIEYLKKNPMSKSQIGRQIGVGFRTIKRFFDGNTIGQTNTLLKLNKFLDENTYIPQNDDIDIKVGTPSIIEITCSASHIKWISVKERLPEEGKAVLCIDLNREMHVAKLKYEEDDYFFDQNRCGTCQILFYGDVTHWSEIEPPQEAK